MSRILGLDEDLTEAVALAHDLGHPPFGHAGERALAKAMAGQGGFDHNAQALRIVARLERRYAAFDGLNLTFEVAEGIAKHNGPVGEGSRAAGLTAAAGRDLDLATFPSAEAQVAAIADDIAYDAHDIDDGLRAGLIAIDELAALPGTGPILANVRAAYPAIDEPRLVHELTRRLITAMIEDAAAETRRRLAAFSIGSIEAVRQAGQPAVAFSAEMTAVDVALKSFLGERVYRHPSVMRVMTEAESVVGSLYRRYLDDPVAMPPEWRTTSPDPFRTRDFLAGMTDRFALAEYERLFDRKTDFG